MMWRFADSMGLPKLACPNFTTDCAALRRFALECGLDGVDWSFTPQELPQTPKEASRLSRQLSDLRPLAVRYHAAFPALDLGDRDPEKARAAQRIFEQVCRLVSKLEGETLTIHVGLGRTTTEDLSWERTLENLWRLNTVAQRLGVRLCLENLAWGWTSRPELFEKMLRRSGVWGTFDIGHAVVSPSIVSGRFDLEDFVTPHGERILNAHVYHRELSDRHFPPESVDDVADRLNLLRSLPACEWWVLELRDEPSVQSTLDIIRRYLEENNRNVRMAGATG